MLTPTLNQLRTLAECEAQTAKAAANQAIVEATKRMEEATRAAVLNPGPGQQLTIQGTAASRLLGPAGPSSSTGGGGNPMPKTGEAPAKRPGLDDERRFQSSLLHHRTSGAGVSTAHIRLTGQGKKHGTWLGGGALPVYMSLLS